ncbi:hypothetical protein SKAU_G00421600 [Synaphobranchus kaupii]|uniref:Uncharacterized protein n=1 Tax=Synaphobranchus kaupii TaxID=118154 RepID=A0A9Q1E6R2_SYNKA|nr:hypothetical protein SKAU_G00421600 [Synaphobranchus kaupii]
MGKPLSRPDCLRKKPGCLGKGDQPEGYMEDCYVPQRSIYDTMRINEHIDQGPRRRGRQHSVQQRDAGGRREEAGAPSGWTRGGIAAATRRRSQGSDKRDAGGRRSLKTFAQLELSIARKSPQFGRGPTGGAERRSLVLGGVSLARQEHPVMWRVSDSGSERDSPILEQDVDTAPAPARPVPRPA